MFFETSHQSWSYNSVGGLDMSPSSPLKLWCSSSMLEGPEAPTTRKHVKKRWCHQFYMEYPHSYIYIYIYVDICVWLYIYGLSMAYLWLIYGIIDHLIPSGLHQGRLSSPRPDFGASPRELSPDAACFTVEMGFIPCYSHVKRSF